MSDKYKDAVLQRYSTTKIDSIHQFNFCMSERSINNDDIRIKNIQNVSGYYKSRFRYAKQIAQHSNQGNEQTRTT